MARSPRPTIHLSPSPAATAAAQLQHPAEFTKIKPLSSHEVSTQRWGQTFFSSTSWGVTLHNDLSGQMYLSFVPTSTNSIAVGGVFGLVLLSVVFIFLKGLKTQRKTRRDLVMEQKEEQTEVPVSPLEESTEEQGEVEKPDDSDDDTEKSRQKVRRLTL